MNMLITCTFNALWMMFPFCWNLKFWHFGTSLPTNIPQEQINLFSSTNNKQTKKQTVQQQQWSKARQNYDLGDEPSGWSGSAIEWFCVKICIIFCLVYKSWKVKHWQKLMAVEWLKINSLTLQRIKDQMFFVTAISSHTLHFEAMYTNRALAFVTIIKKTNHQKKKKEKKKKGGSLRKRRQKVQ